MCCVVCFLSSLSHVGSMVWLHERYNIVFKKKRSCWSFFKLCSVVVYNIYFFSVLCLDLLQFKSDLYLSKQSKKICSHLQSWGKGGNNRTRNSWWWLYTLVLRCHAYTIMKLQDLFCYWKYFTQVFASVLFSCPFFRTLSYISQPSQMAYIWIWSSSSQYVAGNRSVPVLINWEAVGTKEE